MGAIQKVLITGGAGFIGHRLTTRFASSGAQVAVVDNEFSGLTLQAPSANITPYREDIRNVAAMNEIIATTQPQLIIHLAAIHHIPTCERDPHQAMDVNVLGTQTLLNAAEKHGVKRFILASSSAVYDWWETALIEDKTPIRASDVYSTSKITNEHQVQVWAGRSGSRAALARIFNVIGHDDPNGHIIPDILSQLGSFTPGQEVTINLGNTAPKRDYTHADDTADGLFAMANALESGAAVEAYNLSRGAEYSVADLVSAMADYFGIRITIAHDPARVRKVDRLHLLGDATKSTTMLKWQAKHSFTDALTRILSQLAPRKVA